MDRNQNYRAAPPKMGNGHVYPVALGDGGPAHLTTTNLGQTLCNIQIGSGASALTTFGPGDCSVCRRTPEVRHLAIVPGSAPGTR